MRRSSPGTKLIESKKHSTIDRMLTAIRNIIRNKYADYRLAVFAVCGLFLLVLLVVIRHGLSWSAGSVSFSIESHHKLLILLSGIIGILVIRGILAGERLRLNLSARRAQSAEVEPGSPPSCASATSIGISERIMYVIAVFLNILLPLLACSAGLDVFNLSLVVPLAAFLTIVAILLPFLWQRHQGRLASPSPMPETPDADSPPSGEKKRPASELGISQRWTVRSLGAGSALLFLCFVGMVLYLPAFPWIAGGRDQGVYVNTAFNLSKTGSFSIHDPVMEAMSEKARPLFYSFTPDNAYPPWWRSLIVEQFHESGTGLFGHQFPGYYISNHEKGTIVPQFFPSYPALLAMGILIGGFPEGLVVTPLIALLSLCFFFLFCRRIIGLWPAFLTALLLAVTTGQYWYARTPNTEMLVQCLFFCGLWSWSLASKVSETRWLVLSGAAFASLLFVRVDSLILVPLFGCLFLWDLMTHRYRLVPFWIPFILTWITAFAVGILSSTPYSYDIVRSFFPRVPVFAVVLSAGACIGILFVARQWGEPISRSLLDLRKRFTRLWQVLLIIVFPVAIFYHMVIRPLGMPVGSDAWNLVKLGWYVTLPGSLLVAVGLFLLLLAQDFRPPGLSIALVSCAIYCVYYISSDHFEVKDQYWWFRRFIPTVLPMFIIAAGYLLSRLTDSGRWFRLAGSGFIGIIIILSLSQHRFLWEHSEYDGLDRDCATIAAHTAADSIILVPHYLYGLETPLRFIHDKSVLVHNPWELKTNRERFISRKQVKSWLREGHHVYFLGAPPLRPAPWPGVIEEERGKFTLCKKETERPFDHLPSRLVRTWKTFLLIEFELNGRSVGQQKSASTKNPS